MRIAQTKYCWNATYIVKFIYNITQPNNKHYSRRKYWLLKETSFISDDTNDDTNLSLKEKKNGQDFTKFIVLTPKWSYQMSDGFNKAFEKKIIRKENYDKKIWAIPFRDIPFTKFSYLKLVRLDLPISSSQTNAFKSAL